MKLLLLEWRLLLLRLRRVIRRLIERGRLLSPRLRSFLRILALRARTLSCLSLHRLCLGVCHRLLLSSEGLLLHSLVLKLLHHDGQLTLFVRLWLGILLKVALSLALNAVRLRSLSLHRLTCPCRHAHVHAHPIHRIGIHSRSIGARDAPLQLTIAQRCQLTPERVVIHALRYLHIVHVEGIGERRRLRCLLRYGCAIWRVVLSGIMLLLWGLSKGWVSDVGSLSVVHGEKGDLEKG